MTKVLKGKRALLLAEGCKLSKEKKIIEKRLDEIKSELDLKNPDTYTNEAGDILAISKTDRYSEINPKNVLEYLKKQKMSSRFPETVKVQITQLQKFVPEPIYSKWRTSLSPILRYTWK